MRHFLKGYNFDYLPVLLYLVAIVTWRGPYYRLSLYVAIPLLIIVAFFRWNKEIISAKYWWLYLMLIIWIFLSSLFNDFQSASLRDMIPVVAAFLLSFSVYATSTKGDNAKILYLSYCLFFIVLMGMSIADTGFVQNFDYSDEHDRESYTKMDANSYAYYSFFLIMSVRMMLERRNKSFSKAWLFIIYIILFVISLYVALLTASRQVLYLNIPLLLLLVYSDYIRQGKKGSQVLFFALAIIIILVGLPIFSRYYSNSFLATRAQVSFAEDGRSRMMKNAMNIAFDHPLFGVGLGAPITFSHNTYTHLASRCGLPALLIYLTILLRAVSSFFRKWRRTKDSTYFLYFVCSLFFFIGNFLYSYIDGPFMMAVLFILLGDSKRYRKGSFSNCS